VAQKSVNCGLSVVEYLNIAQPCELSVEKCYSQQDSSEESFILLISLIKIQNVFL